MMVTVEQLVNEVHGENLPQRHYVHHKSHMTRPGLEPGTPATNRLSYGTATWMKDVYWLAHTNLMKSLSHSRTYSVSYSFILFILYLESINHSEIRHALAPCNTH
jgi:hypothetical protein